MNKTEILHYLRTNSRIEDERVLSLIDECCAEAQREIHPKTLYRIFECEAENGIVVCGGFEFHSH